MTAPTTKVYRFNTGVETLVAACTANRDIPQGGTFLKLHFCPKIASINAFSSIFKNRIIVEILKLYFKSFQVAKMAFCEAIFR